ncbi:hypothetical protein L6164_020715 [Bauhinia variegata]|uniref:Uncharacterized protein n=1 Tax=Bauhinia variegata TaxID=167791 RepID=A0ACB9MWG0_BAUVA|nr:hypothetical protein L6164_020715 [Bauhinia variegata]
MEFFNKAKAVKLRGHLDKYLSADSDQEKVRQSRRGWTQKTKWIVELVEGKTNLIRLKSVHGRYLTATDVPFLLGMTGQKVVQSDFDKGLDRKFEWEPIRDGFQVKLRSWCGKYLRANGSTPPWRNSITHDDPRATSTRNWILWDVESVELPELMDSYAESVLSSLASDDFSGSEPPSPMSVSSVKSSRHSFSQVRVCLLMLVN